MKLKYILLLGVFAISQLSTIEVESQTISDKYASSVYMKGVVNSPEWLRIISPSTGTDTLFLPLAAPINNQYLSVGNNGQLEWTTVSSSASPANPLNSIQYNDAGSFGGSSDLIYDEARNSLFVGTATSNDTNSIVTPNVIVGKDGASGVLYLRSNSSTEAHLGITPRATQSQDITFEMPAVNGNNLQALVTDGGGVLSWGGNVSIGPTSENNTNNNNTVDNSASSSYIGGGNNNEIRDDAQSSGIYGGATGKVDEGVVSSAIYGGDEVDLDDDVLYSAIYGGDFTDLDADVISSAIGGGYEVDIDINSTYCVVMGGTDQNIQNNSNYVAIFAGDENYYDENGDWLVGMAGNDINLNGDYNGNVGGADNFFSNSDFDNNITRSVQFGGFDNRIESGTQVAILGGAEHNIDDSRAITIGGFEHEIDDSEGVMLFGRNNSIGTNSSKSFVGGRDSRAREFYQTVIGRQVRGENNDNDIILFGDASTTNLESGDEYEWRNRFANGYRLYTDSSLTTGVRMNANQSSWSSISDSSKKRFIIELDYGNTLTSLSQLAIFSWNYIGSDKITRNYSPMAQDYSSLFGKDDVGNIGSDTTINELDLTSTLLAASKGLGNSIESSKTTIKALKFRSNELKARLNSLKALLSK